MTKPGEPEDYGFKPPMTARREATPTWKAGRLVSRATPSMPPRARARHFNAKGSVQRVRPLRSAAGGMRRVMVKVRVVQMTPGARKALMTHVRYVAREGAGAEGKQGQFFDAREDAVDASGFAKRCEPDRHHFRLIVNPEDGRDLPDLKAFTRRFMDQVETDMGTSLDWVAGEHYDTGRPHLHILLRGKRDDGRDLVLPRDYVSHGLRQRSQELATEILGPRQEAARPADSPAFIERHVRRLEAMSREGACQSLGEGRFALPDDYLGKASAADQARHGGVDLEVRVLDVRPLELQPQARGVTWLDNVASGLAKGPEAGALANEAKALGLQRAAVLQAWGVGSGTPTGLGEGERQKLWQMEMESQMDRLGQTAKPVVLAKEGQKFSGVYLDRAHMGGRTYAVIESKAAVTLAPWRAAMEACRGQALTGVLQGGQVDFRFGQSRGRRLGLEL